MNRGRPLRLGPAVAIAVVALLLLSAMAIEFELMAIRSSEPPQETLHPTALKLPGGVGTAGVGFEPETGDGFYADDISADLVAFSHSSFQAEEIGYTGGGAYGLSYNPFNDELFMIVRNWEYAPPVYAYLDVISLTAGLMVASSYLGEGFPLPLVGVDQKTGFTFVEITRYNNSTVGPWMVMGFSPEGAAGSWTTSVPSGAVTFVVDDLDDEVYVLNGETPGGVTVLNGTSGAVIGTIPTGDGPGIATFDARYDQIYVGNQGSDSISVISGVSNRVVDTITVGGTPYAIAADNETGNVLVETGSEPVSNGSVFFTKNEELDISGSSGGIVGRISLGTGLAGIIGETETGTVLCQIGQKISLVNASTNQISEILVIPRPYQDVYYDSSTEQIFLLASPLAVVQGIPRSTGQPMILGLSLDAVPMALGALASGVAIWVLVGRSRKPPRFPGHERVSRA